MQFLHARSILFIFFFNDTATTEIYTLSLHDALPIYVTKYGPNVLYRNNGDGTFTDVTRGSGVEEPRMSTAAVFADRKSTRLNSSHSQISYAVFCLKKKKQAHHSPARESTECRVLVLV